VWGLTGLWHGASWNFVLWGLYFGFLLLGERLVWGTILARLPAVFRHGYALILIMLGWALFYFTDLGRLGTFVSRLLMPPTSFALGVELQGALVSHAAWLVAALIGCLPVATWLGDRMHRWIRDERVLGGIGVVRNLTALAVATALLAAGSYNPFLYFRF
ncbi:MAG: MBOAT family protein, partial [Chloroflexota bacterium]